MRIHCTRYKKLPSFSPPFCAPLAQDANILTREIWLQPTHTSKILSGSIKVCQSYSLYYSKLVYWICLYSNVSYADENIKLLLILSKYICMTARPTIRYFTVICKVTTSKFTAKLLLLSHSENYIKLNFVVVSHKIFSVRLFCAPLPAAPGGNCPPMLPPLLRHWAQATLC